MAILLSSYVCAQDTVRYGDPWYKFNTMPTLKVPSRFERGANLFSSTSGEAFFQEYYNDYDKQLIYGIAYTGSGFISNYNKTPDSLITMWKALLFWGSTDSVSSITSDAFHINYNDTTAAFADIDSSLIKYCKYEYEFTQPTPLNKVVDCVEVYFDNPVLMQKDRFYVGCKYFLPAYDYNFEVAVDSSCSVRWFYSSGDGWLLYMNPLNAQPSVNYSSRIWGVCFPIVKLRCTTPRGLQVAQNETEEYVAQWPADSNAEDYEVAVCYTTQQPADDAVRYIPATGLSSALGHLSPDTTYRIHLRKRCSYTTSGYSDTVASDWSAPVIVAASTGINAASDRRLHFGIQPNPASGSATVELDGNTEGTLTLTDLFGRTLTTMAVHAGTTTAALDLGGLPAGLYLLQLTTKDAMATRRLSVR